jgi:hypothetical protein
MSSGPGLSSNPVVPMSGWRIRPEINGLAQLFPLLNDTSGIGRLTGRSDALVNRPINVQSGKTHANNER